MAPGERSTPASVKFTYEDFLNFPDDGWRHEIIDGEHYGTPSPSTKHQAIVFTLATALGTYLRAQPIGAAFVAPFDVVFSDLDIVEPDLLYISRERSHILTTQHVRGAFTRVAELSAEEHDVLTTPLLPDFAVPLAEIFASPI